jgi:hypothetical protein
MHNGYLINLILVLLSLYLSYSSRALLSRDWKSVLYSVLFTCVFSLGLQVAFMRYQLIHYDFNPNPGFEVSGIPIAAVLFCFTVPLAGIFIYRGLNIRYPDNLLDRYSLAFSNLLLGLCIAFVFFAYTMAYSVTAFVMLFLLLLFIEYRNKIRFMYRFYRTYGVVIVLYFIASLLLGSFNGAAYQVAHTVKFTVAGVPFENYALLMVMLLFAVYLYEVFNKRQHGIA